MDNLWDPRYTPADAELIKAKVNKLIRKRRYRRSDQEDLEQRLALHLWQRMQHFDPQIGDRRALVHTILENAIANILAHDTAQKRDLRRERPLPEEYDDIFMTDDEQDERDQRLDVDQMIASLPPTLQKIAGLRKDFTESEVMTLTGMTRGQIRQRMKEIAAFLRAEGWT